MSVKCNKCSPCNNLSPNYCTDLSVSVEAELESAVFVVTSTITNNGPLNASQVVLSLNVNGNFDDSSVSTTSSGTLIVNGNIITLTLDQLPVSETASIEFYVYIPDAPVTVSANGRSQTTECNAQNNYATITMLSPP